MFGNGGFGWVIEGFKSTIHNAKVTLKAPFCEVLRKKYQKKYNEEDLFSRFTADKRNIYTWSAQSHLIFMGTGLFVNHLKEAYRKKGIRMKVITTGNETNYYESEHGWSSTEISLREKDKMETSFQEFLEKDHDLLIIDYTCYGDNSLAKKKEFLKTTFQKVAALPKEEHVMYLVSFVHVGEETKEAIQLLERQSNIRLLYCRPNYSHWMRDLDPKDIHILFPHYADREGSELQRNLGAAHAKFPFYPINMFQKDYWFYYHFIYNDNGKTGIYFMNK